MARQIGPGNRELFSLLITRSPQILDNVTLNEIENAFISGTREMFTLRFSLICENQYPMLCAIDRTHLRA